MGIPGLVSPMYNQEDILEHINKLGKELYEKNKRKPPRIHVVGYMTTPTDEQFLKTLARENQGRFKRIKPLVKPIVVD